MSAPLVSCRQLYAGYGDVSVVRNVSLEVAQDEIVLLLGPNGAGKTTTLLTIAGLLPKMGGEVEICGQSVSSEQPHRMAGRGLGFVPDNRALIWSLSVRDNLRVALRRDGLTVDDVLDLFPDLVARLKVRAGELSGGEQQMLAVGRAVISKPKILVIDEMSMGLAPIVVQRLLNILVRAVRETHTGVLLVEQHVASAVEAADRAYVFIHGDISLHATCAELRARPELLSAAYLGTELPA